MIVLPLIVLIPFASAFLGLAVGSNRLAARRVAVVGAGIALGLAVYAAVAVWAGGPSVRNDWGTVPTGWIPITVATRADGLGVTVASWCRRRTAVQIYSTAYMRQRPALRLVRRSDLAVHRRDAARRPCGRPYRAPRRLGGHGHLLSPADRPPLGAPGSQGCVRQGVRRHPAGRRRHARRNPRPGRLDGLLQISALQESAVASTALTVGLSCCSAESSASPRRCRCTSGCPTRWPDPRRSRR